MDKRYELIQEEVGGGGYGRIDKYYDTELQRDVAVKVLDPLFKTITDVDKERFKREARSLAKLSHPNIPAIYDIEFEDEFRILFQWINGDNVLKFLQHSGPMSLRDVQKYFYYLCHALEHMHSSQIYHRDIKPQNIIITEDCSSCYLVDLGIALNKNDIERLSGSTPIGTPGYMSPEQKAGDDLSAESDIYALGVVLYECLSGKQPVLAHYIKLTEINETIPAAIDEIVLKALSPDRGQRYASSLTFYDQIENALQPKSSFAEILTRGTLADIQKHITAMEKVEFINLPKGQKRLIFARLIDLVKVDNERMRNSTASFISGLLKHAQSFDKKDFDYLISNAFNYAFSINYSESWRGNVYLRQELATLASNLNHDEIAIMSNKIDSLIDDNASYTAEEKWYYHSLRDIIQPLLANPHCPDDIVDNLGNRLEKLNELTHSY